MKQTQKINKDFGTNPFYSFSYFDIFILTIYIYLFVLINMGLFWVNSFYGIKIKHDDDFFLVF